MPPGVGRSFLGAVTQISIYGHRAKLAPRRQQLSDAIHGAVMTALAYPADKRFHRFIGLDDEDFIHPTDRGFDYTIIEISMFEGRSDDTKRALISELFERLEVEVGIAPHSVEVTICETPRINWGIRGRNAVDLDLRYQVQV